METNTKIDKNSNLCDSTSNSLSMNTSNSENNSENHRYFCSKCLFSRKSTDFPDFDHNIIEIQDFNECCEFQQHLQRLKLDFVCRFCRILSNSKTNKIVKSVLDNNVD